MRHHVAAAGAGARQKHGDEGEHQQHGAGAAAGPSRGRPLHAATSSSCFFPPSLSASAVQCRHDSARLLPHYQAVTRPPPAQFSGGRPMAMGHGTPLLY